MARITPNLWFDSQAEEAATFYCGIFPNSQITRVVPYLSENPGGKPIGSAMVVDFVLDGLPYAGINGGPEFPFTEAISLQVNCADQAEVDHYWERLTADGGQEGPCGWCKDRYGVSWQVVPDAWNQMADGDTDGVRRAMDALYQMNKIDLATLQAAYDGTPAPATT